MYSILCLFFIFIGTNYWIAEAAECKTCQCGDERRYDGEIFAVAGMSVRFRNQYPWLVQILNSNVVVCAGALYNSRWVITAAHCAKFDVADTFVRVLAFYRDDKAGILYKVAEKKKHPQYNTTKFAHDIALFRLVMDVDIGNETGKATTICFPPNHNDLFVGYPGFIAGWGYYEEHLKIPDRPHEALNTIISLDQCKKHYYDPQIAHRFTSDIICAGLESEIKVACEGDVGAPLTIKFNEQYFIVGIYSWGRGKCGVKPSSPSVYTRIGAYMDWITSSVGNFCRCDPLCTD